MADKIAADVSQVNNPLSKKLNKILDIRLDSDKEMLDSLKSLSTFFTENSLRSRRNLRGDIERQSLAINEEFVDAFRLVQKQLDDIYQNVKGMNECCQDMTDRLKIAKEQTHDLIDQTTKLQAENQTLAMKARVAEAFLDKFQLTPEQARTLRGSRDGELHKEFFDVLARVKQIHNDCKVLLRTNQQTAGLEIMESMAMHQEAAYERLYRWTQNECRQLSNDTPDISNLLCEAMNALQDRPVLFRYSLDEFGIARRTAIVRGFIDALTRGGPGGTPRPIELHSHDPFRYTGDMLAWLHQAAYSEKEHLQALLRTSESLATNDLIQDVLGHVTEGICRPFKVRVEQVLVSESDIVTLYRLSNLLKFYQGTMTQILTKDAALLATVVDMETLSRKMFFNSLNCHSSKLIEKVDIPPADLSCPSALTQTLQLLQDILASHDSSVTTLDARQHDFQEILACMIEPLIQMCSMSAAQLMTADMATYMVNCIHVIQKTLALYEFTDQRLEMLQAQLDAHLDTLVSEQASFVLGRSGLANVYNTVTQHQPKHGPLSQLENMDSATIRASMNRFDNYLANPDSLLMPQCILLISGLVRDKIKRSSTDVIVRAYRTMYEAVMDPVNKYKDPHTIVQRTPQQVHDLLPVN